MGVRDGLRRGFRLSGVGSPGVSDSLLGSVNGLILSLVESEKVVSVVGILGLPCALELVLHLVVPSSLQLFLKKIID